MLASQRPVPWYPVDTVPEMERSGREKMIHAAACPGPREPASYPDERQPSGKGRRGEARGRTTSRGSVRRRTAIAKCVLSSVCARKQPADGA